MTPKTPLAPCYTTVLQHFDKFGNFCLFLAWSRSFLAWSRLKFWLENDNNRSWFWFYTCISEKHRILARARFTQELNYYKVYFLVPCVWRYMRLINIPLILCQIQNNFRTNIVILCVSFQIYLEKPWLIWCKILMMKRSRPEAVPDAGRLRHYLWREFLNTPGKIIIWLVWFSWQFTILTLTLFSYNRCSWKAKGSLRICQIYQRIWYWGSRGWTRDISTQFWVI